MTSASHSGAHGYQVSAFVAPALVIASDELGDTLRQ